MTRPVEEIILAQRATAYFFRVLNGIPDEGLDSSAGFGSPLSRRALVAMVGYSARAYARLAEGTRTGEPFERIQSDMDCWDEEIELGSTLPPHALRYLVKHAAVHLSVEWRDLPDEKWSPTDRPEGQIHISETPWRRTVEVYLASIDLGAGGSFVDIPAAVLTRMLGMKSSSLSEVVFLVENGMNVVRAARGEEIVVGALPDVVRWAFDRGDRNLRQYSGKH